MTEALLQKLEEKMMVLLSEVEDLRNEVTQLRQEGARMKAERENHSRKLTDLLSLLDAVNPVVAVNSAPVRPVVVQNLTVVDHADEYAQSSN
jgi:regulator of replication initiation timing